MPRQARLDAPGLLQHVMARGIERRKIFLDDKDRESFLERFAIILEETQTQCYAWALIPNHFHLLLRTGPTPLSKVMRRLMTGYAVTFNKRHKRAGHLFQNRYKSVVCEEDAYLLELIRYIHLNPLRAGLVKDLKELNKYPWSGHSAILGRRKNPLIPEVSDQKSEVSSQKAPSAPSAESGLPFSLSSGKGKKQQNNPENPVNPVQEKPLAEKTIEDILLHFAETKRAAIKRYREFVEKGIKQGTREELQGGGLVRSAGGNKGGLLGRKNEEREKGDARILGSGDFVNTILRDAEEEFENKFKEKMSLKELMTVVAKAMGVSVEEIVSPSRKRKIAHARAVVTYAAIRNLGYRGTEIAKALSLSPPTISQNIDKGKFFLDTNEELKFELSIT